jgi:hypothetical protein
MHHPEKLALPKWRHFMANPTHRQDYHEINYLGQSNPKAMIECIKRDPVLSYMIMNNETHTPFEWEAHEAIMADDDAVVNALVYGDPEGPSAPAAAGALDMRNGESLADVLLITFPGAFVSLADYGAEQQPAPLQAPRAIMAAAAVTEEEGEESMEEESDESEEQDSEDSPAEENEGVDYEYPTTSEDEEEECEYPEEESVHSEQDSCSACSVSSG